MGCARCTAGYHTFCVKWNSQGRCCCRQDRDAAGQLSDKEIRDIVQSGCVSCPNCGSLMSVAVDANRVDNSKRIWLDDRMRAGEIILLPIEETEDMTRAQKASIDTQAIRRRYNLDGPK
jgi:hypothetical protein